jgi:hypothetical protein
VMHVGESGEGARLPPPGIAALAVTVASRVRAILPEGFSCIANDTLVILVRDHTGVRSLDLAYAPRWEVGNWAEDLRLALLQVLSDFQDEIIEQMRQPWPAIPGGAGIAVPHAQIEDGTVRAWYGTDDAIVVALDRIALNRPDKGSTGESDPVPPGM